MSHWGQIREIRVYGGTLIHQLTNRSSLGPWSSPILRFHRNKLILLSFSWTRFWQTLARHTCFQLKENSRKILFGKTESFAEGRVWQWCKPHAIPETFMKIPLDDRGQGHTRGSATAFGEHTVSWKRKLILCSTPLVIREMQPKMAVRNLCRLIRFGGEDMGEWDLHGSEKLRSCWRALYRRPPRSLPCLTQGLACGAYLPRPHLTPGDKPPRSHHTDS